MGGRPAQAVWYGRRKRRNKETFSMTIIHGGAAKIYCAEKKTRRNGLWRPADKKEGPFSRPLCMSTCLIEERAPYGWALTAGAGPRRLGPRANAFGGLPRLGARAVL